MPKGQRRLLIQEPSWRVYLQQLSGGSFCAHNIKANTKIRSGSFTIQVVSIILKTLKLRLKQRHVCRFAYQRFTVLFDALIVGGGPAGLSAALALGRVCRSALLFDSGVYRNAGVTAMHTVLSRDGEDPTVFRSIGIEQIRKYPSIQFQHSNIIAVSQKEVEPGYMGLAATDDNNRSFFGRKLILAAGYQDLLPDDIPGYNDNWPSHM